MSDNGQKFIGRNRAPRVQIEYDVETYGAEKQVNLPFVMGVMGDFSGETGNAAPKIGERNFMEIDVDNFDDRMKAINPGTKFRVPNTLTGEGELSIDLNFECVDELSPAGVARKVGALNKLMEAREKLNNLIAYMDGKEDAEDLIGKIMGNEELLKSLMESAPSSDETVKPETEEG